MVVQFQLKYGVNVMVFSGRKEYPTKMSFDFLETKLIKIEQIIKKTGTIKIGRAHV